MMGTTNLTVTNAAVDHPTPDAVVASQTY